MKSHQSNVLISKFRKQSFDGLVLEHGFGLNNQLSSLLIGLANQLHEIQKKLILVIPVCCYATTTPPHHITPHHITTTLSHHNLYFIA